ncbi:DNA ligase 1, partial [Lecanoromycetidae sp. Uapishka_2]
MPPKQATLGKFFGRPNGSAPKSQQSTLAFGKPKASVDAEYEHGKVSCASETKVGAVDEDVEMDEQREQERTTMDNDDDDNDERVVRETENGEMSAPPQSTPKSPPKRSNSELKDDEDEEEEEPVRKRPRRGKGQQRHKEAPKKKPKAAETAMSKSQERKSEPKQAPKPAQKSSRPSKSVKSDDENESEPGEDTEKPSTKGPVMETTKDDEDAPEDSALEVGEEEDESEEEIKPEVAAKAREKVQSTLKSSEKDPYPDWKPGEPIPYAALCTTLSLIEMTTKRLIISSHCSLFLRQIMRLTPQDLLPTIQLMINKLAADYAGIELGIGESLIMKAIGETTGRSLQVIKADQNEIGDLGELPSYEVIIPAMVEHGIFHLRENCKLQPGVPLKPMLAKPTKSITEVLDRFEGKNFTCEYKYDGERAQIHYVAGDSPQQYTSNLHASGKNKGLSAIFSRNSEDLSKKYPDILAKLNTWIKPETKSFVLDCETVAWDLVEKRVLPFQQLMTRKRKDVKAEDVKVKVCVFAFDMLFFNGESIVQKSLRERRELLNNAFEEVEGEFAFAQYGNTDNLEEIQTLLDESVKASCEGLMVKMLDTDESGYEPSKRSRNWLKVKKDYLSGIGDSLDLVVLGAYFGKGKRTSVYGAFLLACYNTSNETYETVCNIGTGFSEAILEELHTKLKDHTIDKPKPFYSHSIVVKDQPDVWFEPRFVWEVKTADLTLSPRYKAGAEALGDNSGKGISLRFPRFIKEREDKKADEATGSRMVVEMYQKQEGVSKSKGPSVDDDFEY